MLANFPQLEADSLNEPDLYEHKCFPGIIGFNGETNQDFDRAVPLQILYHEGQLSRDGT